MSGQGLISIRLPRSLLDAFRAGATHAGRDLHCAARDLIASLSISSDEWMSLPEPAQEPDNPRVSLYVGRYRDVLAEVSQKTKLPLSSIIRRLFYALFITRSLRFVQHSENKEWRLVHIQNSADNNYSQDKEGNVRAAS